MEPEESLWWVFKQLLAGTPIPTSAKRRRAKQEPALSSVTPTATMSQTERDHHRNSQEALPELREQVLAAPDATSPEEAA